MELNDNHIDQLYRRAFEFDLTSPDDDLDVELRLNQLLRAVGASTSSAPDSADDTTTRLRA